MIAAPEKIRHGYRLASENKLAQARAVAEQVVRAHPGDAHANCLMSFVLVRLGEHQKAVHFIERAAKLDPANPVFAANLGQIYADTGRQEKACEVLTAAVERDPSNQLARHNLCSALMARSRFLEAERHARAGLEREPGHEGFRLTLGVAMSSTLRVREGYDEVARAAQEHPGSLNAASIEANLTNYMPGLDPEHVRAVHERFGRLVAPRRMRAGAGELRGPLDPERRLRVGFVSGDFTAHSVSFFFEPLLERLDRAAFFVACYRTAHHTDEVTTRLRRGADLFRDVHLLSDGELFDHVRADAIDVLIDLSGHTVGHRLGLFAMRPAPVQATFLGYPNTTGVRAIDRRIVDSFTDPPGTDDACVEKLARLDPIFLCHRPPAGAPAIAPPPSASAGFVTFGTFNNVVKLSGPLLDVWARVLERAPGSKLLIKTKGLELEEQQSVLRDALAARGVEAERLTLVPPTAGLAEHLAVYARIDVALDTFPYAGTTTTCEALHMGVPVVTLRAGSHAGRVGASILASIGRPELIAETADEYVENAASLASDRARLAELRGSLRRDLERSPLRDEAGYARRFGALIRSMWRERCAEGA